MKAILIQDAATEIVALAFRLNEPVHDALDHPRGALCSSISEQLLWRAGFGSDALAQAEHVVVLRLSDFKAQHDPYRWNDLTMRCAHRWLVANFDEHPHGGALDVEPLRLAELGAS